jgi:ubiquinone/menaquinone biosynthesis C-methylase UbiE
MEPDYQKVLDQQKQVWDKFSGGWKKWDKVLQRFLHPVGQTMINALQIKKDDHVLDVASGTGEPGIGIAKIAANGSVIGTDISDQMLAVAKENAEQQGVSNFQTLIADVQNLPFKDEQFDAVSCRMGYMFFPDMQRATNEMYRVLKNGGRISTAVFGPPEKNGWLTSVMRVIGKYVEIPLPDPNTPGMFRCTQQELMTGLFKNAGFKHIVEQEITGEFDFTNAERYWQIMTSINPMIVTMLGKSDEVTNAKIKEEVFKVLNSFGRINHLYLGFSAMVINGEK